LGLRQKIHEELIKVLDEHNTSKLDDVIDARVNKSMGKKIKEYGNNLGKMLEMNRAKILEKATNDAAIDIAEKLEKRIREMIREEIENDKSN